MLNKTTQKQDDAWLTNLFKDAEIILNTKPSDINWPDTIDFQVFSDFLIDDVREMRERLKNANVEYLYYVCQHTFNIMDWIDLMVAAGFSTFNTAFENLFDEHFGNKYILQNMYDECFEKWITQKSGQQKIGENFYNILEGKLYYRNRFGQWFEVDRMTAYDLKPNKQAVTDNSLIDELKREYKETWYDTIIRRWKDKNYQGLLPDDFLRFNDKETSPETYFDFTIEQIKTLLKNPVSIAELERWNGDEIVDLEDIVKISAFILDIAKKRRDENGSTLYLLRDCLLFYEAHKTLDIIDSKKTSADQILIGRKSLNHQLREWGYYALTLQVLYSAHQRYSKDFMEFYNEYARLMDLFVSLNPGFATVIADLADYVKEHIRTDQKKLVIFDVGFQGSIALLTKYIIDRQIRLSGLNGKIETDIKLGVGAEWSKKLFGNRSESDYFPMLNRVQLLARSDELYHYKLDSLHSGTIRVVMGEKKLQRKAAIELAILVMVALLAQMD